VPNAVILATAANRNNVGKEGWEHTSNEICRIFPAEFVWESRFLAGRTTIKNIMEHLLFLITLESKQDFATCYS